MICTILASSFLVGLGEWVGNSSRGLAALTKDEECYAELVYDQFAECEDQTCKLDLSLIFADVINFRRTLRTNARSDHLFNQVRRDCEDISIGLSGQRSCFRKLTHLQFEELMAEAGYNYAGISTDGYYQLRTGMSFGEVEFILGDNFEQNAYSASGGYSSSLYTWRKGPAAITVIFNDSELSAKSKHGL